MESSAFPGKIKINLMQLKTYELLKVSNNTKNCTKAVCFFTGNIRKIPFFILIATLRDRHQSEKDERKNLLEAIYYTQTNHSVLNDIDQYRRNDWY